LKLRLLLCLFGDVNGVLEAKGEKSLGGQNDLLVACEGAARRACAAPGK
jgi:hypothetical protein